MATEAELIARTPSPATPVTLARDLRSLGLRDGDIVLVHCSLSALGWVAGGAQAVVTTLLDVVGGGTLVVPTHTGGLSDPAQWQHPPVPEAWWRTVREETPAFDPAITPSRFMGAVAEIVRCWPGARRSIHPHVSFAALGPAAQVITDGHALSNGLGETSPLARLYDLDARILLLGVGHANNTSMHLGEHRSGVRPAKPESAAVVRDGVRRWETWDDTAIDSSDFERVGTAFAGAARGPVGSGEALLMSQREVVDSAETWFRLGEFRPASG